jgi:hypothetical protein
MGANIPVPVEASEPLDIGAVLRNAASLGVRRWPVFLACWLVVSCGLWAYVLAAMAILMGHADNVTTQARSALVDLAQAIVIYLLLAPMISSIVARVAWADSNRGHVDLRDVLKAVVPLSLRVLGTNLLVTILEGIGLLLLVIPGGIALVVFRVALQASSVEGLDPPDSISRSVDLTRGHRWRVFALLLIVAIIVMGTSIAVGFAEAMAGGTRPDSSAQTVSFTLLATTMMVGLSIVFQAAVSSSLYVELVRINGGFATQTAEVFA